MGYVLINVIITCLKFDIMLNFNTRFFLACGDDSDEATCIISHELKGNIRHESFFLKLMTVIVLFLVSYILRQHSLLYGCPIIVF